MPTGVFRLKGSNLKELGRQKRVDNAHQVSLRGGVSYPTAYRYLEKPMDVEAISLRALYGILIDGLGMTSKDINELKFMDVFEAIPDGDGAK